MSRHLTSDGNVHATRLQTGHFKPLECAVSKEGMDSHRQTQQHLTPRFAQCITPAIPGFLVDQHTVFCGSHFECLGSPPTKQIGSNASTWLCKLLHLGVEYMMSAILTQHPRTSRQEIIWLRLLGSSCQSFSSTQRCLIRATTTRRQNICCAWVGSRGSS
jgi:hypothetical protein